MKKIRFSRSFIPLIFTILLPLISCFSKMTADQNSKTYLALGDSYTIGEAVSEKERFPDQTAALLREQHIKIADPEIIATTGWTTKDLIDALNNDPPKKEYSVVSLLIGVNNQFQGKTLEEYKSEFALLLSRAIDYAGNKNDHVFVLSIPDYSVTSFAKGRDIERISKEIDAFNAVNKQISIQSGVNYIDITPISREARHDAGLIASDGLHPSGKQYKKWAELLVKSIVNNR